jgi:antitoxin (DNA-binding transcriptional repressor) of toxin-antitoxin stability system
MPKGTTRGRHPSLEIVVKTPILRAPYGWVQGLVIHFCLTMGTSIRDLRNRFPKVRKLVESHGEVILTEKGKPRYRLTLYSPESAAAPSPVDYWARLNSYQPRALTKAQSRALRDENRGER